MTLEEFAAGALKREIEGAVNAFRRRYGFGVFSRLVSLPPEGTPRDTNRANNGWDLTVGSPGGSDPGEVQGRQKRHAPKRAQASRGEPAKAGINDPIYITNNVPYIVDLNNGHSQQAPSGFVENAVEAEERVAGLIRSDFA